MVIMKLLALIVIMMLPLSGAGVRQEVNDTAAVFAQQRAPVRATEPIKLKRSVLLTEQARHAAIMRDLNSVIEFSPTADIHIEEMQALSDFSQQALALRHLVEYRYSLNSKRMTISKGVEQDPTNGALVSDLRKIDTRLSTVESALAFQQIEMQQSMQHQNRQFTMLSNIMKSKHDTAKAAINNIR